MTRIAPSGNYGIYDQLGQSIVHSVTCSATATVASGAANTVVSATPGVIGKVLVTVAGTGSGEVPIYDNATTNSGTIVGMIPATVAVGSYYTFDLPVAFGVTVANVLNGPVLTVSYS